MGVPHDRSFSRSPSRLRIALIAAVVVLFVLMLSANGIAQLFTDKLWFNSLGYGSVWTTMVGTQVGMAAGFTAIFAAILWCNLYLADRLAQPIGLFGPEDDLVQRYQQLVGPHIRLIRIGISVFFGLFAGMQTAQHWETWMLFRNGGDFGFSDPLFNKDAGFYVFRLPFWTFLIDWFFAALVFTLILTVIAHYMNGGIRAVAAGSRLNPGVKLHLSILLAILAGLRALAYWFDRYELVTGTRSLYTGAFATDVEIQLPALNLLVIVSLAGCGVILYNIRRTGFGLPLATVGIWLVVHIVVGSAFPAMYQRLRVVPNLSSQEAPFIQRNIEATRYAYGLDPDHLVRESFDYQARITEDQLADAQHIFSRVQVLDPALTDEVMTKDEAQRKEYRFADPLDTDRYLVDGELTPVVISARMLNLAQADAGWENQHLAYTHGYGAVIARANQPDAGPLRYLMQGIGPNLRTDPALPRTLERPQIYYSEGLSGFAVVGANRDEIDYPGSAGSATASTRYEGEGGVPAGSFFRRLAFSIRFQDLATLISGELTSDSRILMNRDVLQRARTVAPFLEFDADPYPVVADGKVQWIIDGYTTTDQFPYAQANRVRSLAAGSGLAQHFNYVRNSVKVVVDSYDGTVTLYVVDDEDPLVMAYWDVFPSLFESADSASDELRSHFRYPVDLFKVQSEIFATYHVNDPVQFLQDDLSWRVASEPVLGADAADATSAGRGQSFMEPQYRLTALPGNDEIEYVLQRAFVPSSGADSSSDRPELTGILVARSDGDQAGNLVLYELPPDQVAAPDLVAANMRQNTSVAGYIASHDPQGIRVRWGEMQLVMVEDTLVYVRSLYMAGTVENAVPELTQFVAANGERIGMGSSLEEALQRVTTSAPVEIPPPTPDPGGSETPPPDPVDPTPTMPGDLDGIPVSDLLALAHELLDAADLLQDTDPAQAEALRQEARHAIDKVSEVLGLAPPTTVRESGET